MYGTPGRAPDVQGVLTLPSGRLRRHVQRCGRCGRAAGTSAASSYHRESRVTAGRVTSEPDVILETPDLLVFVEAKLGSGKTPSPVIRLAEQVCGRWRGLAFVGVLARLHVRGSSG